jgi:hypothetical protein
MFIIDKVLGANGETEIRKRRVCRKCHRVRVTFRPAAHVCEDCRDDRTSIDLYDCIAAMRRERAEERRAG